MNQKLWDCTRPSAYLALYMLDYTLSTVGQLSKTLQTKQLDMTMISQVDAVLKTLDDAITPATN